LYLLNSKTEWNGIQAVSNRSQDRAPVGQPSPQDTPCYNRHSPSIHGGHKPALAHPNLHRWDITPEEAIQLQRRLVDELASEETVDLERIHTVAGVDVSVKDDHSWAAIAVLSFPELHLLEVGRADSATPFPYIPGLLAFREGPVILQAYANLTITPDVLIFDGQGQAHPRRLGIAAHVGLWLAQPTIGCGKTLLTGKYLEPGRQRGDFEHLLAQDGKVIGFILRTRAGVKPVYISSGNHCDLDSARRITLACTTRYRLPEPIRAAHNAAGLHQEPR